MKPEKALQILTGLCSRKEYCTSDMLEKLRKWEISDEESRKIMEVLYRYQFVDDTRFARIYAEDKFRFNHWGKQKIGQMLRQKNIDADTIEKAFQCIDASTYREECKALLEQKMKTITASDSYQLKTKLLRFGAGRGFDLDTLYNCIEQLL